jgi:hypothetical protein
VAQTCKVAMNYINYDIKVVQAHQVKLVGWTYSSFVSPGEISAVSDLQCLRDALKIGTCKWVRLTTRELNKHMQEYEKRCQAGEVVPKKRKERNDKGKKRKAVAGNISDGEGNERPRKKKKSSKEKGSARREVVSACALEKRKETSTSSKSHVMSQLPPSLKHSRKLTTDTDEQETDSTDDD